MDKPDFVDLTSKLMDRNLDNSTLQEIVASASEAKAAVEAAIRDRQSSIRLLEMVGMVIDIHRDDLLKKIQEHGVPTGLPEVM